MKTIKILTMCLIMVFGTASAQITCCDGYSTFDPPAEACEIVEGGWGVSFVGFFPVLTYTDDSCIVVDDCICLL
jgi:hypothetical protein